MKRALRFLPALLWAATIFALSSRPRLPEIPGAFPGVDKVAHATVFAVLTALLLWGDRMPGRPRAWGWAFVAAFYGVSDELHQSFVPGRSVEVLDGVADAFGAFGAVWLLAKLGRLPGASRLAE